jgi:hypothetical protein
MISSEAMLHFYQTTWCHIPEDSCHSHCHENLESEMYSLFGFLPNHIENYIEKHVLFTMLVNYINSDMLSTICTHFLLLIQHLKLLHFLKSQFSWQYFMSDLEFFLLSSFFFFLSGSYKPMLQCWISKFFI